MPEHRDLEPEEEQTRRSAPFRLHVVVLIAAALSVFYAASITRLCFMSHHALASSWIDRATFSVDELPVDPGVDTARAKNFKLYPLHAPATGLMTTPFSVYGKAVKAVTGDESSMLTNIRTQVETVFAAFCGALAVLMCILALLEMGVPLAAAAGGMLTLALGTLAWKYSTVLYSHATAMALISLMMWAVVMLSKKKFGHVPRVTLGVALGLAVATEYNLVILLIPAVLIAVNRDEYVFPDAKSVAAFFVPLAVPLALLALYHTVLFGAPWNTPYSAAEHHGFTRTIFGTFSQPLWGGIKFLLFHHGEIPARYYEGHGLPDAGLIFFAKQTFDGLFILSPVLFLALLGVGRKVIIGEDGWFWLGGVGVFVLVLLTVAKHTTAFGGNDFDPRYLAAALPAIGIGLAAYLDEFAVKTTFLLRRYTIERVLSLSIFALLGLISLRNAMYRVCWRAFENEPSMPWKWIPWDIPWGECSHARAEGFFSWLAYVFPGINNLIFFVPALAAIWGLTYLFLRNIYGPDPEEEIEAYREKKRKGRKRRRAGNPYD